MGAADFLVGRLVFERAASLRFFDAGSSPLALSLVSCNFDVGIGSENDHERPQRLTFADFLPTSRVVALVESFDRAMAVVVAVDGYRSTVSTGVFGER